MNSLIESLFVLGIILILSTLTLPVHFTKKIDQSNIETISIYYEEVEAIKLKERKQYENIHFNELGDISHATTIHREKYDIVFQLGNGRFYVR